jgi:hypothetical protein
VYTNANLLLVEEVGDCMNLFRIDGHINFFIHSH